MVMDAAAAVKQWMGVAEVIPPGECEFAAEFSECAGPNPIPEANPTDTIESITAAVPR